MRYQGQQVKTLHSIKDMAPCLRYLWDSQVDTRKKRPPLGALAELWAGDVYHQHKVSTWDYGADEVIQDEENAKEGGGVKTSGNSKIKGIEGGRGIK